VKDLQDRQEYQEILKNLPALTPSVDIMLRLTAPLAEGVALFKRLSRMEDNLLNILLTD
jgi:hypothetical protein